ncbi:MAG TPA: cytochrome c [Sediminibacterium sp.]
MKKIMVVMMALTAIAALSSFADQAPKKSQPGISKTVMDRGKLVYMQRCLACHQVDGGGVPHLNAPLDGATLVKSNDKSRMVRIVLKGMNERIEIDGEYYSNNMTPLADLSDQQIADVLTYVRNSWSNKASAVTAAEVKAIRAKTK